MSVSIHRVDDINIDSVLELYFSKLTQSMFTENELDKLRIHFTREFPFLESAKQAGGLKYLIYNPIVSSFQKASISKEMRRKLGGYLICLNYLSKISPNLAGYRNAPEKEFFNNISREPKDSLIYGIIVGLITSLLINIIHFAQFNTPIFIITAVIVGLVSGFIHFIICTIHLGKTQETYLSKLEEKINKIDKFMGFC